MSNQTSPDSGANESTSPAPAETYTKEQMDRVAAAARKEAETKLSEATTRLNALEAAEEERKTAAMTELEKAQAERDEFKNKFETSNSEVEQFKAEQKERDEAEEAKVEKQMEGLTDSQKSIVEALDLYKRLDAINEFKQIKSSSGMQGGGKGNGTPGVLTAEEIMKLPMDQRVAEWTKTKAARQ